LQGIIGLLVAACIGAAVMALGPQGDMARRIARWEPRLHLISSSAAASPISAQSSPTAVQAFPSKVPPRSALPGSAAQAPPVGTPIADPSPEQEELLHLLRGFLAVMEHDIEELKASIEQLKTAQEQMVRDNAAVGQQLKATQEQMLRDNAAVAEQLKTTQQQIARLLGRDSEQQSRPKTSASSPRSIDTLTGRSLPKSSPQARTQPSVVVRGRTE
jgi:regulator of replication initiation timing